MGPRIEIERSFRIDAGHRVYGHEGKCKNLHGHSYQFDVRATAPKLDPLGRVIDFGVMKERIGAWLDEMWDHGMILWKKDPIVRLFQSTIEAPIDDCGPLDDQKLFILDENPTAENLALFLLATAQGLMVGTLIQIVSVTSHETPNCRAFASWENV